MLKKINTMTILFFCFTLSSCQVLDTDLPLNNNVIRWDFDHNIQFRQTQLSTQQYRLEVIKPNKANFEKVATFLLRQSYSLCGGYHYKIEMLQGIEGFDDKRTMPNYLFPSLIAKIECERNP